MNHQLAQPLIESVHSVLSMMTQTACSTTAEDTSDSADDAERVVGSISISGEIAAQVRLVFPQATGDALVRRMTGMEELTPDCVDDALGELCNMIVGSAKSSLSLEHAALSCPDMSREPHPDMQSQEDSSGQFSITTWFESEAGPFKLILHAA